jgi:hypothetical protein
MITTKHIIDKVNKIKRFDDLVALNHYIDYLLFRELDEKTELGQALISGLEAIVNGQTYSISSSQDILKVADEL